MSDLPAPQQDGTTDEAPPLHPALDAFVGLSPTPQTEAWSQEAAQKVQNWLSVRAIADGAAAAADEYVGNIDIFKSGLVQFVHNDPTGLPLALDLVPGAVNAFLPAENAEHADPLIRHTQSEIVRSGVQSLAFHDEGAAQRAMDLYGEHLSDEDKSHLGSFIGTMAQARAADHAAQVIEEARRARLASDELAHRYLGTLTDPGTGDVRFPNNWMRDMMADRHIDPPTKAVLSMAHDRLVTNGDPLTSDPEAVVALLDRALVPGALTPTEVWRHAGDALSLADTQMIAGAAFPKTPEQLREVQGVAQTLASARDILASPENGLAGQVAFGRFVNWLLPEYRRAGPGSLDPNSETWILGDPSGSGNSPIMRFMPSAGDILVGALPRIGTADRPSLGAIFGKRISDTTEPTDWRGFPRTSYGRSGGLEEPNLVSGVEEMEQETALARAHYQVMKSLPQAERMSYFRARSLTSGDWTADDFDKDPVAAASHFMNLVHYTPSKDPLAAWHGYSDRDPGMGPSDARLFFGDALTGGRK